MLCRIAQWLPHRVARHRDCLRAFALLLGQFVELRMRSSVIRRHIVQC